MKEEKDMENFDSHVFRFLEHVETHLNQAKIVVFQTFSKLSGDLISFLIYHMK